MRETASGRRQAPLNVTSSLDAARELGIRDAQEILRSAFPPACTGERGEEGSWTGATQRRGHDGQVKQGEQEGLHARDSVGPMSGATPRGLNPGSSERIGNSRRTGRICGTTKFGVCVTPACVAAHRLMS